MGAGSFSPEDVVIAMVVYILTIASDGRGSAFL